MQKELSVTVSSEDLSVMGEKLLHPTGQVAEEDIRAKVESWYQQMLPFIDRMSDHKFDDVAPAIVISVR